MGRGQASGAWMPVFADPFVGSPFTPLAMPTVPLFRGSKRMVKDNSASSGMKHFVLDTNVLLHNPNSLFAFADNHVIIPFDVLEELDKFKKDSTDVGRSARTTIRHIDGLREKGHLNDGVKWNGHGGTIRVVMDTFGDPIPGLDFQKTDNRIIGVAYHLKQKGKHAVFISKDINARIKCDSLGVITRGL